MALHSCCAGWTPDLYDVHVSGYWPATIHFYTLFDKSVFQCFKDMKLAAPGNSHLTFIRILEAQTTQYGRVSRLTVYVHNIYLLPNFNNSC